MPDYLQPQLSWSARDGKTIPEDRRDVGAWRPHLLLVLGACVAYLLARFIATAGAISLDEPEYWLLALVPLVLINLMAKFTGRNNRDNELTDANFHMLCWITSLLWFLVLRTTLLSEYFEFSLYRYFQYKMLVPYLMLSCVYSLLGYGTMLALLLLRRPRTATPNGAIALCSGALLNSALFYLLVLRHPF
jgi:hypothetical protein